MFEYDAITFMVVVDIISATHESSSRLVLLALSPLVIASSAREET